MQPQISQIFVVFFFTRFYILTFPPFVGSKGLKLALEIVPISRNWVQLRYESISQQIPNSNNDGNCTKFYTI